MALTNRTTQWKPLRIFGGTFQQAMAQGFSKGIFQRPTGGTQSGVTGAGGPPVIVADAVPTMVDHRQQNLEGPIKDQGPVGACTAFALSATIDNAAIRAGKMQAGAAGQAASANHVWAGYGFRYSPSRDGTYAFDWQAPNIRQSESNDALFAASTIPESLVMPVSFPNQ